jgi:hypothetical protein
VLGKVLLKVFKLYLSHGTLLVSHDMGCGQFVECRQLLVSTNSKRPTHCHLDAWDDIKHNMTVSGSLPVLHPSMAAPFHADPAMGDRGAAQLMVSPEDPWSGPAA